MEIYKPGTTVKINEIEATVLSVQINENRIIYHLSWWVNSDRKTEWVEEFEIHSKEHKEKIGFK